MSWLPLWISLGTATVLSGSIVLDTGRRMIRRHRALTQSPETDLSEIVTGPVSVRGSAIPIELLHAPLSNRPGMAVRLIAERWVDGSRGAGGTWKVFLDIADVRPFFLDINGRRVRVEATYLDLDVPLTGEILQASALDLPSHLADLLDAHHARLRLWPSPSLIRCREYLLRAEEVVTVCGEASLVNSPGEGPYRAGPAEIAIREGPWGNVLVSDRTHETLVRRYSRRLLTGLSLVGAGLAEAAVAWFLG